MSKENAWFGIPMIPQKTTAALDTWLGSFLFGVYSSILLIILMFEANIHGNGASGISILLGIIVFFGIFSVSIASTSLFGQKSIFKSFGEAAVVVATYILTIILGLAISFFSFSYECNGCNNIPLFTTIGVQAAMLFLVYAVYSRPLVPQSVIESNSHELHLTNWWRMAQAILSLAIALGIGLFAQFLISSPNIYIVKLIPLIIGLAIGIIVIVAFIFMKMFTIERLTD